MGVSIIITDHNIKNLFETTDRNYIIADGSIIAEGTSRDLLKNSKAISHYFGSDFTYK
jgi:lipopolysaccharide export system ATP-binding protein